MNGKWPTEMEVRAKMFVNCEWLFFILKESFPIKHDFLTKYLLLMYVLHFTSKLTNFRNARNLVSRKITSRCPVLKLHAQLSVADIALD